MLSGLDDRDGLIRAALEGEARMQLISQEEEDARDALLLLDHLGAAIRLSLEATLDEPMPTEMGLLLMRLALLEVLKDAAGQEAKCPSESFF